MHFVRAATLLLLLAQLAPGCASNPSTAREHAVIQINSMKVAPQILEISGSGNSIAFTNWSNSAATVQFPASMVNAFTCEDLRPQFVVSGDRIESVEVLGDSESLTTPCPLLPGTYAYEVWLSESRRDRENPQLKLKGTIVVAP